MSLSVVGCISSQYENKSKFITEDHFAKHVNFTIHSLNSNETLIKTKRNYLQKIIKGPPSLELGSDRKSIPVTFN